MKGMAFWKVSRIIIHKLASHIKYVKHSIHYTWINIIASQQTLLNIDNPSIIDSCTFRYSTVHCFLGYKKSLNCFVLPAWGGCVGDKGQEVGRQTADAGDPDVLYDLPELSKEGASGSVPAHSEGWHLCRHCMIYA